MGARTGDRGDDARLVELVVADPPAVWADAGFTVLGGAVRLGDVGVRLIGPAVDGATGIVRWAIAGLDPHGDDLDGLPTDFVDHPGPDRPPSGDQPTDPPPHPNGVTGIDHVVLATPGLDRTMAALTNTGLACRRVRDTTAEERPMRQAFFRLGPVVLEVVGGTSPGIGTRESAADDPATWFGLALDVVDLDETAARLGDGLGPVRPAVQRGRRIATVRHRRLGLSVALAVMDDHGGR